MSNIETVREMMAAFARRDLKASVAPIHPDIVWDFTRGPVEDLRGVYEGAEGSRRLWGRWLDAWETIDAQDPELIDAGEHVFMWVEGQVMRGKTSGIEVKMDPYAWVWTFEDGKVVRGATYGDRAEALSAAGLE